MALAVKAVGSRHATRGAWRGVVAALPVVKTHNAGGIRLRPTQHIVAQMPCERGRVEYRCGLVGTRVEARGTETRLETSLHCS